MIPIHDDNPTRRRAWVTLVLIALNIGVYFLIQPHGGRPVVGLPEAQSSVPIPDQDLHFTLAYAAIPCEVVHDRPLTVAEAVATFGRQADRTACGVSPSPVDPNDTATFRRALFPAKNAELSILLSMFLHGGLLHIGGNMLFLWVFGNNIEDRFGRFRYLLFYLAGGFFAALAHILVQPRSTVPIIGASGAIAAVMGAYLVLYPKVRVTTVFTFVLIFVKKIPAAWLLIGWLISQFFLSPGEGVAWMAHVGGFVFGALLALVVRAVSGPTTPPGPRFVIGPAGRAADRF